MEENVNKDANIALYLNIKLFPASSNGINKNSLIKEINTFIEKKAYVVITNKNEIKAYKNHSSFNPEIEKILFLIERTKNKIRLVKILGIKPLQLTVENINKINNLIYKVIGFDYDIYLKEKDIINFGGLNYIIQQIHINNENDSNNKKKIENKENEENEENEESEESEESEKNNCNKDDSSILDFKTKYIENISCDICHEILVSLCKCKTYEHLEFIKGNIKIEKYNNNKKTVTTYNIKLYSCNKCGFICPLKIKLINNEKISKEQENQKLVVIKKPKCDFIILELLGKVNEENKNIIDKYIYVIKLNDEEIFIGKRKDGKIIIDDDANNIEEIYCILKFNKNDKKLYIKNKNENYYTYIVVKKKIEITEKEIFLKLDRVLMKAKLMKKEDLEKIKNDKPINPLDIIKEEEH